MATLTKGISLGASEQVTNTKLHNLVDLGSITNIVDSDISASANISDSKFATISTNGKVSGRALTNLNSLPSSAGALPRWAFVSSLASGALIRWNGTTWYASMT
jgi:hypothetical protein